MMNDLEKLQTVFEELGIRHTKKPRIQIIDKRTWPYTEETIPGLRIRVSSRNFPVEKGLLDMWDGYSDFYFFFDFDENGKFEKCGAFE